MGKKVRIDIHGPHLFFLIVLLIYFLKIHSQKMSTGKKL